VRQLLTQISGRARRTAWERRAVELTNYETRITDTARLEVELEVQADDEREAAGAAYAWLADLCRNGRWLDEAGHHGRFRLRSAGR
jgi:hypothetical protein